jgi:predicted nucleic acid-binding protein
MAGNFDVAVNHGQAVGVRDAGYEGAGHSRIVAGISYRRLRTLGVTVRKTADIIIGIYCIKHRLALLHDERDFAPMEVHLGLQAA